MLRAYSHDSPAKWSDHLAQVELTLNCFPSTVTGKSPHEVVYGTIPNLPIDIALTSSVPEALNTFENIQQTWQQVRNNLERNALIMKTYFDKHRRELNLQVGSYAMLSTRNISLPSVQCKKLKPRYIGPYKIVKRVGRVSYKLDLPTSLKIHNVFHISLLKPYVG